MNFFFLLRLTFILGGAVMLCNCGSQSASEPDRAADKEEPQKAQSLSTKDTATASPLYANLRFREVQVVKAGSNQYKISGEAQVFEAAFSWVITDGYTDFLEGHETTDAGAPAWGSFHFSIALKNESADTLLYLELFEYSAKDGSPQHKLRIPLPQ